MAESMKMKVLTPVSAGSGGKIAGRPLRFFVPAILLLALALAVLLRLTHYAPFYAPAYFFWIGLILALIGLASLIRPLRFLLVFNRGIAAAVCCFGLLLSAGALFWPVPMLHVGLPWQRLDGFMPDYSFREYHEVRVNAPPKRVMQAARQVSLFDMPAARLLMRLRALAGGGRENPAWQKKPILEMMSAPGSGFLILDVSADDEFVGGMVGRPWTAASPPRVATAEQFKSFQAPGNIKVVFNFLASSLGKGRTLLSTETRICGNDARARRIFGRYWRIIYPGSAIIRRVWLDAIAARAEGS